LKDHQLQGVLRLHAKPAKIMQNFFHDPLNHGIYISPDLEKTAIPKNRGKISSQSSCQTLALGISMKVDGSERERL